jgi:hypothetical protein
MCHLVEKEKRNRGYNRAKGPGKSRQEIHSTNSGFFLSGKTLMQDPRTCGKGIQVGQENQRPL